MFYFVVEMEQFGAHVHTKLVKRKIELYMKGMVVHLHLVVGLKKGLKTIF